MEDLLAQALTSSDSAVLRLTAALAEHLLVLLRNGAAPGMIMMAVQVSIRL